MGKGNQVGKVDGRKRGPARKPGSLRWAADEYGVSATTAKRWRDAGVDLLDGGAVEEFRSSREGEDRAAEPQSLQEARRQLVNLQSELAKVKLAKEEGRLVEREDVEREGARIAVLVGAGWDRLENDLPAACEGMDANQLKRWAREYGRQRRREMEDAMKEVVPE